MSGAPQNPLLRLVTGSSVAETRMSGARAGRARVAELMLPNELTVSRLHAKFSCDAGEWRMIGLGRNGIAVNGTPLAGEHLIRDGDMIRWGRQADAPTSRVQIR
jgi:pSer/pThr/pTyr-binding forkhead associated (FHA) protein